MSIDFPMPAANRPVQVSIAVTDVNGARATPSAATFKVYGPDSSTERVAETALAEEAGETGLVKGTFTFVTTWGAGTYTVLYEVTVGGVATIAVERMNVLKNPWAETATDFTTDGSMGFMHRALAGLLGYHALFDKTAYDTTKRLTSARWRLYASKSLADLAIVDEADGVTGHDGFARFDVTRTYETDGATKSSKSVKG